MYIKRPKRIKKYPEDKSRARHVSNLGVGRQRTWTEETIVEFADKLIEWAKQPDSFHLADFSVNELKKAPNYINELASRYPCVAEALDCARSLLGARYIKNGLIEEWNSSLCGRWCGVYDKEYKNHDLDMFNAGKSHPPEAKETVIVHHYGNNPPSQVQSTEVPDTNPGGS